MAGDQPKRPATYQDLLAVPDHLVAEILGGELYTSPRPAPRHATVSSALGGELVLPYDRGRGGPGGWRIIDEPEIHFGTDIVVPDLAGWRRHRMPTLPRENHFSLAPDWACEVLSPSTHRMDRAKKLPIYAREGVPHLWLVDPDARTVEVLRLESAGPGPARAGPHESQAERWVIVTVTGDEARVRLEPFTDVEIDLASLWAD